MIIKRSTPSEKSWNPSSAWKSSRKRRKLEISRSTSRTCWQRKRSGRLLLEPKARRESLTVEKSLSLKTRHTGECWRRMQRGGSKSRNRSGLEDTILVDSL